MDWLPDLQDLIKIARRDGVSSLNLNGRALDSLTESLRSLTTLTQLDVSVNRLTVLPAWLGDLTGLTRLDLIGNPLTRLPQFLGNPDGARHLHIILDGNRSSLAWEDDHRRPDQLGAGSTGCPARADRRRRGKRV